MRGFGRFQKQCLLQYCRTPPACETGGSSCTTVVRRPVPRPRSALALWSCSSSAVPGQHSSLRASARPWPASSSGPIGIVLGLAVVTGIVVVVLRRNSRAGVTSKAPTDPHGGPSRTGRRRPFKRPGLIEWVQVEDRSATSSKAFSWALLTRQVGRGRHCRSTSARQQRRWRSSLPSVGTEEVRPVAWFCPRPRQRRGTGR